MIVTSRARAVALVLLALAGLTALLVGGPNGARAGEQSFGRDTPGSDWFAMGADYKRSSRFDLDTSATVTALAAYVDGHGKGAGSQQLRFGIYSDRRGHPDDLLASTTVGSVSAGAAAAWLTLQLEQPLELPAGSYHLTIHSGATGYVARYSREPQPRGLESWEDDFADGLSSSYGRGDPDDYEVAIHAVLSGRDGTVTAPVNTALPTIAGTPQVGQTLSASTGSWSGSPTYRYQWQRCDTSGSGCGAISGADGKDYTLASADADATIRVTVTASNSAGSTTATSAQTAQITSTGSGGSTTGCTLYASPAGSDGASGSASAPFETVDKLIDALDSGQTGCLYGDGGAFPIEDLTIGKGNITLTSVPGQRAKLRGSFYLNPSANGVTLESFDLDNGPSRYIAVKLNADDVTISNMDITNGNKQNGSSNFNGICVLAGPGFEKGDSYTVSNLLVERSRIHNCGDDNHEHSLYLESVRDARIVDNYLYGNYGLGLDMYPDAQGTVAEYNVIYGNARGGKSNVVFSGEEAGGEYSHDHASSNNLVRYNVITNAVTRYNVDSYFPSTQVLPTGNLVEDNCVWNAPYGDYGYGTSVEGYTERDNKDVDPHYVNAPGADFRLQSGSPCTGYGPRQVPASGS